MRELGTFQHMITLFIAYKFRTHVNSVPELLPQFTNPGLSPYRSQFSSETGFIINTAWVQWVQDPLFRAKEASRKHNGENEKLRNETVFHRN